MKRQLWGTKKDRQLSQQCRLHEYYTDVYKQFPGFIAVVQSNCFRQVDAIDHMTMKNSHSHVGKNETDIEKIFEWMDDAMQQKKIAMILCRWYLTNLNGHAWVMVLNHVTLKWHILHSNQHFFSLQWSRELDTQEVRNCITSVLSRNVDFIDMFHFGIGNITDFKLDPNDIHVHVTCRILSDIVGPQACTWCNRKKTWCDKVVDMFLGMSLYMMIHT